MKQCSQQSPQTRSHHYVSDDSLSHAKNIKGMSLIELFSVVIIITVVAGISAPFLGDLAAKYQAESAAHHGMALFKLCRIEALKRYQPVTCTINQTEDSILVQAFLDADNNQTYNESADELIKQSTLAHAKFIKLQPTQGAWVYNGNGLLDSSDAEQIKFCPATGDRNPMDLNLEAQGATYLRESETACDD